MANCLVHIKGDRELEKYFKGAKESEMLGLAVKYYEKLHGELEALKVSINPSYTPKEFDKNLVIQSENVAPAPSEHKTTSDNQKPTEVTSDKKSIEKVKVKDLEVGDEVVLKGKEGTWKVAKKTKDGVDLSHTTKQGSMFKGADDGDIEGKVVNRSENAVVVVKNKSYADFQKSIDEATNIEDDVTKKLENHYRSKGVSEDVISQLIVYGNNLNDFKDIMPEAMSAYDPSIKELHDKMESATKIRVGIEGEFVSRVIDDIGKSFESVGVTPIIIEKVKKFFEEYFKYGRSFDQFGKKLNANKFNDLKQELVFETYSQIAPEQFRGVDKYEDIPENIRQKVEDTVDAAMSNFKQNILDQSTSDNQQPTTDTKSLGKDFTQSESASVNLSDAGSGGVGGDVKDKIENFDYSINNIIPDENAVGWVDKNGNKFNVREVLKGIDKDTYNAIAKKVKEALKDTHYYESDFEAAIANVYQQIKEQSLKATPQAETTSDKKSGGEPTSDNINLSENSDATIKYNNLIKAIEKLKAENPKEFKKDGTPKSNSKILPSYKALADMATQAYEDSYLERQAQRRKEAKVIADKKDTGFVDGMANIASNSNAAQLFKSVMSKGLFNESDYNQIGTELALLPKDKNGQVDIGDVAEIVQSYIDNTVRPEKNEAQKKETEAINKAFEERQAELSKNLTPEQIQEEKEFDEINRIFAKVQSDETPTKKEIDYVNQNAWLPKGFVFGKNGLEEESTSDNNINPSKPQPDAFDKAADNDVIQSEKPNSYKGIFNPKKTGIIGLDELLKDDGGYHYFYKGVSAEVVMMSPDEYLKKVRTDITRTDRDEGIYDEKKEKINEAIDKGAKIDMPYLSLKENGKAHKQEGRNRATIAKERGEKLIPVFIEKDVSFDDKIAKGSEYIKSAIKNGATTKEEVLSKLKEQGLHHDAIRFIDNNFDEKAIENLTSDNNINPSKPQPDAFDKAADATIAALKKNKIVGNADMRKGDTMMGGNGEKIIRAAFDASRVIYHTTKSLAEAIKKALKTVRDSDWYKNLSGDQKSEIDSLVRAQINAYAIQSENGGALKDVESTTKALDNLDETNKQKLEEAFGVLYHGSEIDFDKFEKYGVRIPALGLGYYFTPTLEKAKQYGNKIKRIVLKDANILDWDKLKGEERKIIRQRLESLLPKEANGLGKIQEKHFNPNEKQEALTFLQQKREQTKDYFYERGKARPLNKWGDTEGYTIVWADEGIENANDATLLGLAQQYDNNIAISLGYDGAKYGNETVVFDNEKIINATNEVIAEAYHKAKKDGSNPELVKAVEDAIATEQTPEQKMAAAKAELARAWNASGLKFDKNAGQNLGFMYDPNVDIKRQVDLFKALYNVAKLAIEQAATKLKNITAKDFIAFIRKDGKSFGNITDAHLTDVFNEANKPPVEELDLDMQDQAVKDQIMIEAQNLITTEEFKDAKEFSLRLKELYGIKETDAKAIYDKLVDFINVQTEDPFKIALRGKGAVTAHMNNTTINESSEDEIGNRTYLANSFDEMNEDIDAVFGRIKAANPNNWEKIIADKILKKLDERDMQAAIFADRFVTYLNTYLADHQRSPNYTAKALEYKGYRREILARRQKFTQEYATYFAKLRELKINNPLTLIKESGMLTAAERKAAKEMDEKLKGKKEYDASGKKKPFVEDSALDKAAPTSDKKGKSTSDKKDKPPTEKQAKKAKRAEVKKDLLKNLAGYKNNAADLAIKVKKTPC